MNTNRQHFQRGARGVYKCDVCGRSTRVVDQSNDRLCNECYELAGYENSLSDNGSLDGAEQSIVADLYHQAVKRGGNADLLHKEFRDLLANIGVTK